MSRGPDPNISNMELLHFFRTSAEPAFTASEIADAFSVSEVTARNTLERAVDDGYMSKKKPGERTIIYWLSEKGLEYYADNVDDLGSSLSQ